MRAALSVIDAEHRGFATVLHALRRHLGPVREGRQPPNHDLFGTILTYADSFMERFHHPKEDEHLFRAVRSRTAEADAVLLRLQHEHASGPAELRRLHEALGQSRSGAAAEVAEFAALLESYIAGQEAHMRLESGTVFPIARRVLTPSDWEGIDQAFHGHSDPFFGAGPQGRTGSLFSPLFGFAPPEP
jgi:branched-chain amino acid transport system ATP-binding protein